MPAILSHQGEGVSHREADFAGMPAKLLLGARDGPPEARAGGLGWESGGLLFRPLTVIPAGGQP